jgi:myo-inositol-1(or 4)-monophosphatase
MTPIDPQSTVKLVIDIARRAGDILRTGFAGRRDYTLKSTETDLVTEFDTKAESLIIGELRKAFPDHRIHAEESGRSDHDGPFTWYIDPLDGTNNFAQGLPHFATSIALYELDQPLLGVINDPMRRECFWATPENGAWVQIDEAEPQRLAVTTSDTLITSILVTGFPYDKHLSDDNNLAEFSAMLRKVRGMRRFGSAALDLAYVAAGRFDGYWEGKLNPWDVAAGILMITEAGGKVTGLRGDAFDLHRKPVDILTSNGRIHTDMQRVLGAARTG